VVQQAVKKASVAGRQLFAVFIAHKVLDPAPIAAIAAAFVEIRSLFSELLPPAKPSGGKAA